MRAWTRVGLPIAAAAMLLPAGPARADITCGSGAAAATSTSTANFNATPIPAGRTVWFSSVVHPDGIATNRITTLRITGQSITFDGQNGGEPIQVPDSVITFSPAVTTAMTTFDAGSNTWRTTVPTKDVGNIFAAGVAVPVTSDLPGNIKAVSWTATFISTAASSKPHFQWSAAVYTQFGADPGSLDVKPVDKDNFSVYPDGSDPADNGNHAGTPETYKAYVTAGGRGPGGTNYTGALVAGPDIAACQAQPPDAPCVTGAAAAGLADPADFNGTAIPAGDTIWFSSVVHPDGISTTRATTLRVTGQTITLSGQTIDVPDGVITFSPAVTTAVTSFDADTDTWRTTVPARDVGNVFATGVAVPVASTLPGGIKAVTWTATTVSPTANVKPKFQWSAAVYTSFGTDLGSLDVKPVDKDNFSVYPDGSDPADNGNHAGTPEQYKTNVTKGARGDGGTNYTGGLVGGADVTACIPQRVIVDTDIFSSVDDVGALAIAFDLQLNGEATVLGIGVNMRVDRPSVAADSWRCAGAIASFYGGSAVPIGAHMPDDGTDANTPDFIGPCAALGPADPPAPQSAVSMYRKALAGAPDHSVVLASTGYFGNLADLLKSPPDAISPLNGQALVAQKVSLLVSMAGGYGNILAPDGQTVLIGRARENNVAGDPASAQYVAANWPTKLVWAGYEIGNAVHTGNTTATRASLNASHPASSPVRAAYVAFLTHPDDWYYSYDLVAVYYAVRTDDPTLDESMPGTNAIDSGGGNVFTPGSTGVQSYLRFSDQTGVSPSDGGTAQSESDAAALTDTLDGLLDALPPWVRLAT